MYKVAHILPKLSIGGAEVAAMRLYESPREFSYEVVTFRRETSTELDFPHHNTYHSIAVISVLKALKYLRILNPDVVLYSLWRSRLLIPILWFCMPKRTSHILFIHSTTYSHFFDRISVNLLHRFCSHIFVDSSATFEFIKEKSKYRGDLSVIPHIFNSAKFVRPRKTNRIAYVGRVHARKAFENLLIFMAILKKLNSSILLDVYGPTTNLYKTKKVLVSAGLANSVRFCGIIPPTDVAETFARYSFSILLSPNEGFAMSVAESMQQGCVPIVMNSGEIASYCKNNYNAIVVGDANHCELLKAAQRLCQLNDNADEWKILSQKAESSMAKLLKMPDAMKDALKEIKDLNGN